MSSKLFNTRVKFHKQNFGLQGKHITVGNFERVKISRKFHKQKFGPQGKHILVGIFEHSVSYC